MAQELGAVPIEITAVSFNAGPASDPEGPYNDLSILMGHTELESLTDTFDDNWSTSGTLVFSDPSYSISGVTPGSWFTFQLDTPFLFDGSSNLLIELAWEGPSAPPGQGSIYTFYWATTGNRVLTANDPTAATGFAGPYCNNMLIEYQEQFLWGDTFGGIKAAF